MNLIEKVLRRFISDDCTMALAALEKFECELLPHALSQMCRGVEQYGSRMDGYVIRKAHMRKEQEMERAVGLSMIREIVAKALMGDKFDKSTEYGSSGLIGQAIKPQAHLQQFANVAAAAQGQFNLISNAAAQQNYHIGGH